MLCCQGSHRVANSASNYDCSNFQFSGKLDLKEFKIFVIPNTVVGAVWVLAEVANLAFIFDCSIRCSFLSLEFKYCGCFQEFQVTNLASECDCSIALCLRDVTFFLINCSRHIDI